MKWISVILFACCVYTNNYSQVQLKSFYFETGTKKLTPSSEYKLDSLLTFSTENNIQVIEMNAFSEGAPSIAQAKKIAQERIDIVCSKLKVSSKDFSVNNYGIRRIELNFVPKGWNRVDVYFFVFNNVPIYDTLFDEDSIQIMDTVVVVREEIQKDTTLVISEQNETSKTLIPNKHGLKIDLNLPYVVPILFVGGTEEIIQESYPYLDELYDVLAENKDLYAHIRGHVCCGRNKSISKKRAKVVYTYLTKKGISKDRLSFKGYSNKLPRIFPERTEEDRDANRRVDVIFSRPKTSKKQK